MPTASNETLLGFQNQCDEALKTSQAAIKQVIVAARTQELTELQHKQGTICTMFLCNTAEAFLLVSSLYNDANLVAVCNHVMKNPTVSPVFSSLNADSRKLELEKWFPDVAQDLDTDIRADPSAVAFTEFLIKIVEKCLYLPIKKYNEAKTLSDKITALRKLNASVLVTKKTEDTVMKIDQEHTISPQLLDQLIADKVKKETAKLLKNNSRGATGASLKKKNQHAKQETPHQSPKTKGNGSKEKQSQRRPKAPISTPSGPKNTVGTKNKGTNSERAQLPSSNKGSKKKGANKPNVRPNKSGKQQS